MWIFGYGSLIWRPDFAYVERRPGYIRGWTRRFFQGSTDHRGVPGAPGRVVTLLREEGGQTSGMAYRIEGHEAERILASLDYREKGGYERHYEPVFEVSSSQAPFASGSLVTAPGADPPFANALVYLANEQNPNYLGPASAADIARQAVISVGPSGHNVEYILELAEALRASSLDDPHVFEVEAELRRLLPPSPHRQSIVE